MSNIISCTLVATLSRINIDFPESAPHGNRSGLSSPGIMSAPYNVDLDAITTKLGRFLAENVSTTQRDDDASRVILLAPKTAGDSYIEEIARNAGVGLKTFRARHGATLDRLAKIRADIERLEARIRMYGHSSIDCLRSYGYEWPVFGSVAVRDAVTPEQFFDACGTMIRRSGAVIVSAGLGDTPLPEGLAASMCQGRGLDLLRNRFAAKAQ